MLNPLVSLSFLPVTDLIFRSRSLLKGRKGHPVLFSTSRVKVSTRMSLVSCVSTSPWLLPKRFPNKCFHTCLNSFRFSVSLRRSISLSPFDVGGNRSPPLPMIWVTLNVDVSSRRTVLEKDLFLRQGPSGTGSY